MAYSGKYIPKNKNKYRGDPTGVVYRSHWEKLCFLWCDRNPNVKYWSSEETVIPYFWDIDKKFIKGINPSTLSNYNRNHGIK